MFERFTDRARRVVILGQEEARVFNHNYIGTEHILLGLIHEGEGVAFRALASMGVTLEAVRGAVMELIGRGSVTPTGHIPFTPRAKRVLELSLREALVLGHNYIGTEHILLGLIYGGARSSTGEGVATKVFSMLGCDSSLLRQRILEILADTFVPPPSQGELEMGTAINEPTLTPAQQAHVYVLAIREQIGIEKKSLLHSIAICRNANDVVGWSLDERADRLERQLHELQTKLDSLSEVEARLRDLIDVQRRSEEVQSDLLGKIKVLLL